MNTRLKLPVLLCLLIGPHQPVAALELFGVDIESTSRDELRGAVKDAGVVLIREGGDDEWFDVYDSSTVFTGSTRLYLGFVRADQRFAFAEYEFNGFNSKRILRDLTTRYGAAETRAGQYVSDSSYLWQRDGIEIRLSSDWHNYKTRLSYVKPANLADLRAEQQSSYRAELEAKSEEVSFY